MERVVFILLCSLAFILLDQKAASAQFGADVCYRFNPSPALRREGEFSVVVTGHKGDLIEFWEDKRILYAAHGETREAMGGASDALRCAQDVRIAAQGDQVNMVTVRVGYDNDQLHAYGFERNSEGKVIAIHQVLWHERDFPMNVYISGNYMGTRYLGGELYADVLLGRERDRRVRLCFNPKTSTHTVSIPKVKFDLDDPFHPRVVLEDYTWTNKKGWSWSSGESRRPNFGDCDEEIPSIWSTGASRTIEVVN